MSAEAGTHPPVASTFDDLCREFPPRPIRSAGHYGRALARLDELVERYLEFGEADRAYAEIRDYLDVLALLVEDYRAGLGEGPGEPGPPGR